MKLTKTQEEACNLLSTLASKIANEDWDGSGGAWSMEAQDLSSRAIAWMWSYSKIVHELATHERFAEAEALIRDGSVR